MCCLCGAAPCRSHKSRFPAMLLRFWVSLMVSNISYPSTCPGTSPKLHQQGVIAYVIVLAPVQLSGMVTLAIPCSKLLFSALYFPCKASVG